MTAPPQLIDAAGRPFPLDSQLGSGGEGAVFAIPGNGNLAAKIYHPSHRSAERFEKLNAMIAQSNSELLKVAAWPTGLLFDARSRAPVGFVMPRLIDFREIWCLYLPVERLKFFPSFGWRSQVGAASNLAAAFDEVHKAGCVIGDVQLRNAHVSPQALVRLVDCDSFQVNGNGKRYLCGVGLAHYTPPELQGKDLRNLVRTENHDLFGLAVLIYQLLFVGRHPYAGVYRGSGDPSFEQLITEFRFAQGPMASSWGMDPPPFTPTFADIPPDVGMLFRRAFERGSEKGSRPKAIQWCHALKQLVDNTVKCTADEGHQFWRGAKRCVWCEIAAKGGPEYYFGVSSGASTFAVDEEQLREVIKRLEAFRPDDIEYDRNQFTSAEPVEGEELPEGLHDQRTATTILILVICLCVLMMPLGFIRGFICIIAFLAALVFSIWLALLYLFSPWQKELQRRQKRLRRERNNLRELEDEWQDAVVRYHREHDKLSRSIRGLIADCRALASQYQAEVRRLAANAEAVARLRHLRFHLLADAEIPKIGAGRKQILASYNIFTAAEVDENTIRSIKGFGDALTRNLMNWKAEVLQKFRFDPMTAVSPGDQKALTMQFRARQQQILTEANGRLQKMATLAPACQAEIKKILPELREAVAAWEQADADLRVIQRR